MGDNDVRVGVGVAAASTDTPAVMTDDELIVFAEAVVAYQRSELEATEAGLTAAERKQQRAQEDTIAAQAAVEHAQADHAAAQAAFDAAVAEHARLTGER